MCSLTFLWSVCPLSRPLIANTHVQLDKQEVSKGWISRETETIFITLYLTLIKICYCPFKESCSEIMIKNTHTHSFPDFILSTTCLGCYVYGACTRSKAEDINHKKLTFWFAIMHAPQPVGLIFFFSPLNWRGGGKRQRGGIMWCHQISWLSTFVLRRTITRCPADAACGTFWKERGALKSWQRKVRWGFSIYLLKFGLVCQVFVKRSSVLNLA